MKNNNGSGFGALNSEGAFDGETGHIFALLAILIDRYTTGAVCVTQEDLNRVACRQMVVSIDESNGDVWLQLEGKRR